MANNEETALPDDLQAYTPGSGAKQQAAMKEAAEKSKTNGFRGYDWMIEPVLDCLCR